MIKKNQPIKFSRPMSSMKLVFEAVDRGTCFRCDLAEATGLNEGQVRSALYNLRYVGAILIQDDGNGRKMYYTPGRMVGGVPACWRGVNSVFNAALPISIMRQQTKDSHGNQETNEEASRQMPTR